jgi:error-prone DNA polymerase
VATNDVLYHTPERRPLQDVLTCIREHCTLETAGYRLEANAERHLKSPAEMARLFQGFEAAVAQTEAIAARCQFSLDELAYEYPDEPVPSGATPQSHLTKLTWQGAESRYPDGIPEQVSRQLKEELALIEELVLRALLPDRARHCRMGTQQGHPVPGTRLCGELRRLLLPRHYQR